jgi:hypothetical protein
MQTAKTIMLNKLPWKWSLKWIKLGQSGPEWTIVDQSGPEWTKVDQSGPQWTTLHQT